MKNYRHDPTNNYLIDVVNDYCFRNLGVLPNLDEPRGYNDKINWLKIYDQMYEQVICCNKLLARSYVAGRINIDCLLKIYQTWRSVDDVDAKALPERYVLKSNHDSGSVYPIIHSRALASAKKGLRRRIKNVYGIEKGEWAYSHIVPYVFAEEYMVGPIIDYKFHCCNGDIRWVQIISDRAAGKPRETIVDENHASLPLHMDHEMMHDFRAPVQPVTWERMKSLARILSEPFRYVRVDLYQYEDRAIFGELTFWPLAGCYRSKDEPAFGRMLNFDTSFKRPMIHNMVGDQYVARRRFFRRRLVRAVRGMTATGGVLWPDG